ncbi:hypothetical protein IAT38_002172 [Cryptococcus sp. DSM 104549]
MSSVHPTTSGATTSDKRSTTTPVRPQPLTTVYVSTPSQSHSVTSTSASPGTATAGASTSPRPILPQSLVLSLTHPHPSTSQPTAFFLACLPDPITFLHHSAGFIASILSLGEGASSGTWRFQIVQLELEDKDGLAATSGGRTGVSLHWVGRVMHEVQQGRKRVEEAVKEFKGVLLHELVHTIQHDGGGSAPGWLIESVADYLRLQARLDPPHWRKAGAGRQEKGWEDGYDVGARFLGWLVGDEDGRAGLESEEGERKGDEESTERGEVSLPTPASDPGTAQAPLPTKYPDPLPPTHTSPLAPHKKPHPRPGPFPDLVRLIDARLQYERWDDEWWEEMTGDSLGQLWDKYLDYYA